jgi:tetratricopeptide (TPR) repeat protein
MAEKKLNDSGLVDLIHQNKSNVGLQEIRTLVTGSVLVDNMSSSSYYKEQRTDYTSCVETKIGKDGKPFCIKYRKYNVDCISQLYTLSTNVKFIRVADSKEIYSNNFTKSQKQSQCLDQSNVLPSKREVNTKQAKEIANEIAKLVAPSYFTFFVDILDDEDVKFSSDQSKQLEVAITMLKTHRFEKAKELFSSLNNVVNSSTVKYNLGVTFEALGELYEAKKVYKEAEDISLSRGKVIKEMNEAMTRVEKNLQEYEKANKQIEAK